MDDKVNHLEAVAPLGVRCALAAWGYNGAREQDRAREAGLPGVHASRDAEARALRRRPSPAGNVR